MAKLDNQRRISIPNKLLKELNLLNLKEVGICCDFEENIISVIPHDLVSPSDNLICVSKVDQMGRFFFPKEAIFFLNASIDSFFLIYLHNNRICIRTI